MNETVKWAGFAGLIGAILVGAGEFILQYTPQGGYEDGYQFFADVPKDRLTFGHYLSVLAAPLYVLGYWHLAKRLDPKNTWVGKIVFCLGSYAFIVGAVWLGQRVLLALTAHEIAGGLDLSSLQSSFAAHNEPLVNVLRVAILVISGLWIYQILKGRSTYPIWMAIANPFTILALIFALYFAAPKIGVLLLPNAMNVAHIVVFGLSLWTGRHLSRSGF